MTVSLISPISRLHLRRQLALCLLDQPGDATPPPIRAAAPSNSVAIPTTDNGSFTVYARIIDKDGDFTDYQTSVTVNN